MYRIINGVKTPYHVMTAIEALETAFNDAEREEFCTIMDMISNGSLRHVTCVTWRYEKEKYFSKGINDDFIISLLKKNGYHITVDKSRDNPDVIYYDIYCTEDQSIYE
ncbi:MAG: hypothetical protein J6U54_07665 [Clostridiales bacterium]|nr:hypothetical protein [Clostridiales bacterium]